MDQSDVARYFYHRKLKLDQTDKNVLPSLTTKIEADLRRIAHILNSCFYLGYINILFENSFQLIQQTSPGLSSKCTFFASMLSGSSIFYYISDCLEAVILLRVDFLQRAQVVHRGSNAVIIKAYIKYSTL